ALLEGVYVVPVPGNANVDNYEHHVPDFPYPVIVGLGSVTSQPKTLLDGTSKAFNIVSTDYVQNARMASTVCCVFDTAHPCWSKTPILNYNTVVFYIGRFSDATTSGSLQVELESITLNIGMADNKLSTMTSSSPPSKRRKF
ncbi:hypothetical protein EDD17DRAFT_1427862, partial [Pisolithus thermaeus]